MFKAHHFQILYDDNDASGIHPIYNKNMNKFFIKYDKSNYINRYKLKHRKLHNFLKIWYNFWIKNNQYLVNCRLGNKALKCTYYDIHKNKCKYQYDNERIRDGLIIVLERARFNLQIRRSDPTFDRIPQKSFQIILYDEKKNRLGTSHGAPY